MLLASRRSDEWLACRVCRIFAALHGRLRNPEQERALQVVKAITEEVGNSSWSLDHGHLSISQTQDNQDKIVAEIQKLRQAQGNAASLPQ